jgi:hypothetical protein
MCALWVADGARKLTNVNTDGTVRRGWTRADIARAEWRVAQHAQAEAVAPLVLAAFGDEASTVSAALKAALNVRLGKLGLEAVA